MSIEEVEALNPHFRWNKRKQKSRVTSLYKKLATNSFAIGCRSHPGIVQNRQFSYQDVLGADCDIVSLMDGIEGSCSIFHCSPDPISGSYARWLRKPFNLEACNIYSGMKWCSTFDYVDKYYTEEDFEKDKLKFRDKIKMLDGIVETTDDISVVTNLVQAVEFMLINKPFQVDLGYSGETYRYNRSVRSEDFATARELEELAELEKYTTENKSFYKGLK